MHLDVTLHRLMYWDDHTQNGSVYTYIRIYTHRHYRYAYTHSSLSLYIYVHACIGVRMWLCLTLAWLSYLCFISSFVPLNDTHCSYTYTNICVYIQTYKLSQSSWYARTAYPYSFSLFLPCVLLSERVCGHVCVRCLLYLTSSFALSSLCSISLSFLSDSMEWACTYSHSTYIPRYMHTEAPVRHVKPACCIAA